jgi:superfamily II DNA or RNA helicase
MKIKTENHISTITECTDSEYHWIRYYLSIAIPQFRKNYATGRVERTGIQHISFVKKNMTFPTGFVYLLRKGAEKSEPRIELSFEDARIKPSVEPIDIDLSYLRYYQKDAVEAVVKKKRGIIWHSTAAGKTVEAVALTQRIPIEWLFLVQSKDLLHQTVEKYKQFSGKNAGIIGDGIVDLSHDGNLIVATAQTLNARRDDERLWGIVKTVEGLIVDECFVAGTLVDGRPIETIKIGDYVTSYDEKTHSFGYKKVTKIFKSIPQALVKITLFNKQTIVCTPEHPFLTDQGWKKAVDLSRQLVLCKLYFKQDEWTTVSNINIIPQTSGGTLNELCKDSYVYNLEIESNHTYLANNIVVHNCHGLPANTIFKIATAAKNAYYRIGLSVGPYSRILIKHNGNTEYITIKRLAKKYNLVKPGKRQANNTLVRAYDAKNDEFVWARLNFIIAHEPNKKCVKIKTAYGREIVITKDHSIYRVIKKAPLSTIKNICKHAITSGAKIKWSPELQCVRGDQITKNDFLYLETNITEQNTITETTLDTYPLVTKERPYIITDTKIATKLGKRHWSGRYVTLKDLAYMLGYYIGNGWTDNCKICFSIKNSYVNEFLAKMKPLEKILNITAKIRKMPRGSVEIRYNSALLVDIIKSQKLDVRAHKKIIPNMAWKFGKETLISFIEGLEKSDGHRSKRSQNRERIFYTTTSLKLAYGLAEILKRVKIVASIHRNPFKKYGGTVEGRRIINNKKSFAVHWSPMKQKGHYGGGRLPACFVEGSLNGLPVRIKDIKTIKQPNLVYDLQVENYNNFVANGILVHNSGTPLDRSDRKGMLTIGALGPVIHRVKTDELTKAGYLSEAHIEMIYCEQYSSKPTYQGAYGELIVRSIERNKLLVQLMQKATKPNLTFVKQITHGQNLTKRAESAGLRTEFVWGQHKTQQRKNAIERLVRGDIDCIVSSPIFTQGVDIPELKSIIVGTSGKSVIQTLQRIGRGMRITETKNSFEVYDIFDYGCKWLDRHSKERKKSYERENHKVHLIGEKND